MARLANPIIVIASGQDVALDLSSQSSTSSNGSMESLSQSSNGSTNVGGSTSTTPKGKSSRRKRVAKEFNDDGSTPTGDEYKAKRDRNNEAVKKSRQKSKIKLDDTLAFINRLSGENTDLANEIDILTKEVKLIRSMYASHMMSAHHVSLNEDQLITPEDAEKLNIDLSPSILPD